MEAKSWVSLASGTKISHEAARRLLACPNSDVYKSWSWLRKVAKATPKKSAAKRVKPGCPPKVFAWMTGDLLAVRTNSAAVREILHCGEATPNQQNLMKDIDLIEEIDSGEWTLARRTLIEDPAIGLSGTLKTQTIHLIYDDTSGLMGFRLYDCGKLTEEEFLDAGTDENGLTKFQKTVDRRFKALGIGVPASSP